jgi:hypothetical protein
MTPIEADNWQADMDADALTRARDIEKDGTRLARARARLHHRAVKAVVDAGLEAQSNPHDTAAGLRRIPDAR